MSGPGADLLEGFEYTREQTRLLSQVPRQMIVAQQRGEHPSTAVLAEYDAQLERVDADVKRMVDLVARMWAIVGKGGALTRAMSA